MMPDKCCGFNRRTNDDNGLKKTVEEIMHISKAFWTALS